MRVGILGGGQLARMTIAAAIGLGIDVAIFEREADSPAGRLTAHEIVGEWEDPAQQTRFAALCDVITLESEFVDPAILEALVALGVPVRPGPATLSLVGDKLRQKETFAAHDLPLPAFRAVETVEEALRAGDEWGWPIVLKARRLSYDGYGNAIVRDPAALPAAWARLGAPERALYAEAWVPFRRELAVMVARSASGGLATYPVVETIQAVEAQICRIVRAPATVSAEIATRATAIARQAVEAVGGIGVVGVELFEREDGAILLNEIAPRPHNSGHYTIEGCVTSQFENHLRAILDLPLGATDLVAPAAVMVNILGERAAPLDPTPRGLAESLAVPNAHVHLYGKRQSRPGRKMGHVTALGPDVATAEGVASHAAALIRL
ncbi:MAG TPA: 5-(carboxyamino)imidazole ribonucleotide synthase [Thermomicrobiales bacterium]|jgi:5-(carboxyamino)imidazole ribonucleotide synthase